MTAPLSARIAALEAQAAPLDALNAELARLLEQTNAVSCQIQDAVRAQHLLSEIEGHAARVFGEPESVRSDPAPVPEAQPQTVMRCTQAQMNEVHRVLAEHGRPMSRTLLGGRVSMPMALLTTVLEELEEANIVIVSEGKYRLRGAA